ncbi:protein kinase family protein [Oscillatoria acuminata]|uniref:Mn2+-dependent serine/threonine protein kinase n=1 Tax=Oscillatoria acuminata PCC 6304 TaxID=56110 RepID=K9TQ16_9CYAN|nr:protein kinase family protein [Oscillatoria acuminata]AFY84645.1 Mn2+-dependent serine/threonine protein kinase [Oscillatoria acuminata PCC 6304]
MLYPSLSDYGAAIRNPHIAFRKKDPKTKQDIVLDPVLVKGHPIEITGPNGMKSPWSAAGGFAVAFKYKTPLPNQVWAVRCFKKTASDVNLHYQNISKNLQSLKGNSCGSYFVDFLFLDEGIRVNGKCYPTVRMEWVEGKDLKTYIRDNLKNPQKLRDLAMAWIDLSKTLFNQGIAHGDLQHGNILVIDTGISSLKLIDYDSLYFCQDGGCKDDFIKGIPDYQHPLRGSLSKQCREIDFFSQLVIYLSIIALAESPSLWNRFKLDQSEHLLFSKNDFSSPDKPNNIFEALANLSSPLQDIAWEMKHICKLTDFKAIPSLETVLTKAGILSQPVGWFPQPINPTTNQSYFPGASPAPVNSTPPTPPQPVAWNPSSSSPPISPQPTPSQPVAWNPSSSSPPISPQPTPSQPVAWNPIPTSSSSNSTQQYNPQTVSGNTRKNQNVNPAHPSQSTSVPWQVQQPSPPKPQPVNPGKKVPPTPKPQPVPTIPAIHSPSSPTKRSRNVRSWIVAVIYVTLAGAFGTFSYSWYQNNKETIENYQFNWESPFNK